MNHHMTCKHSKTSIFVYDVIKSATISLITMKKNTRQTHPKSSTAIANIPDGYTIGTGPDGQQYLVPQFMVPDLDQAFASYRSKTVLDVSNSPAGVSKNVYRTLFAMPSPESRDRLLCQRFDWAYYRHAISIGLQVQSALHPAFSILLRLISSVLNLKKEGLWNWVKCCLPFHQTR